MAEASPEKKLATRKPVPLHQNTRKTDAVPEAIAPAIIKYLCLPTESAQRPMENLNTNWEIQ